MADDNVLFTHSTALTSGCRTSAKPFRGDAPPGSKHGLLRPQSTGPHAYHTVCGVLRPDAARRSLASSSAVAGGRRPRQRRPRPLSLPSCEVSASCSARTSIGPARSRRATPSSSASSPASSRPDYLWIGCADGRVPADEIVDHHCPASCSCIATSPTSWCTPTLNCLSVLRYAVDVLDVEHVIVCNHYGCGGVQAALQNRRLGLIDNWLRHVAGT